jgi:hypothetical protein
MNYTNYKYIMPHTERSRNTVVNGKWCTMHHLLSLLMSIYLIGARIHLASEGGRALNQVKPNHFCFFMYLIIIFELFFFDVMELKWSCPQPSQAEPLPLFYVFSIFLIHPCI